MDKLAWSSHVGHHDFHNKGCSYVIKVTVIAAV